MDPKDRSDMGGSSDAKNDATPDNFDGNTLKIDHGESAPVVNTPVETPNFPDGPKHIIEPEKPAEPVEPVTPVQSAEPVTPVQPTASAEPAGPTEPTGPAETPQSAAPTTPPGIPVNPLARKAPDFIGTPKSSTLNFQNNAQNTLQNDIPLVVAQPPQKKSKMPILIVAIIILVVIIGAAIFTVSQKQNGGNILTQNAELVKPFNNYANYLLYGSESDDNIDTDFNQVANIKMSFVINNDSLDDKKAYFNNLKNKFDNFYNTAQGLKLSDDLASSIQQYNEVFTLNYLINTHPTSSELYDDIFEQVANVLSTQSSTILDSSLEDYLKKQFADFTSSNFSSVQQYGNNSLSYWNSQVIPVYTKMLDQNKASVCQQEHPNTPQDLAACLKKSARLSNPTNNETQDLLNSLVDSDKNAKSQTISIAQEIHQILEGN